jgi:3-hydroxyacyl-CoA dehydrogenase
MVESGFASPEDVDTAMVAGCGHPEGPLALADLIGLDTTHAVACSMYAEFKEPLYAAPPLLLRMVEAGLLGRKSGRGFFEYAPRRCAPPPDRARPRAGAAETDAPRHRAFVAGRSCARAGPGLSS